MTDKANETCMRCGKTLEEHADSAADRRAHPRMPCYGLKEGFIVAPTPAAEPPAKCDDEGCPHYGTSHSHAKKAPTPSVQDERRTAAATCSCGGTMMPFNASLSRQNWILKCNACGKFAPPPPDAAATEADALEELVDKVFGSKAGDEPDVYAIGCDELSDLQRRCRAALASRQPHASDAEIDGLVAAIMWDQAGAVGAVRRLASLAKRRPAPPAGDAPRIEVRHIQPGDDDKVELVKVSIGDAVKLSRAVFQQERPGQVDPRTDIEALEDYAIVHWAELYATRQHGGGTEGGR